MTLLQALPDPTRIRQVVDTVTGDGSAETGLATVNARGYHIVNSGIRVVGVHSARTWDPLNNRFDT